LNVKGLSGGKDLPKDETEKLYKDFIEWKRRKGN